MSGFCSMHVYHGPTCYICNYSLFMRLDIEMTREEWHKKLQEVIPRGLHECPDCGFKYFAVFDFCLECAVTKRFAETEG